MKNLLSLLIIATLFFSCSHIPAKSIFEPLTTDELAGILKKDTAFAGFYKDQQMIASMLGDIDKAKFHDVTYRGMYKMYKYVQDTNELNPQFKKWGNEWEQKFGPYRARVDSVLKYWADYKAQNSLDKYVTIEFSDIQKEYFSYINAIKDVNIGFKFTPLQGKIEQMKFKYKYTAKIDPSFGKRASCILTSPIEKPTVQHWGLDYLTDKTLEGLTTAEFIRDYDIQFEITDIRKDGANYSISDLNIPESVTNVFDTDSLVYPNLYASNKEDIAKEILLPEYLTQNQYRQQNLEKLLKDKFPAEFNYMEFLNKK